MRVPEQFGEVGAPFSETIDASMETAFAVDSALWMPPPVPAARLPAMVQKRIVAKVDELIEKKKGEILQV